MKISVLPKPDCLKGNEFIIDLEGFSYRTSITVDMTVDKEARIKTIAETISSEMVGVLKFKIENLLHQTIYKDGI